jgi:mannose-6-phosphate isomerase-like protein (cupin superfamily)
MNPKIIKASSLKEYLTPEGCFIYENWGLSTNDPNLSIARARVEPKVTTKAHHLEDIQEIYVIAEGEGLVYLGNFEPTIVAKGDVVVIPAGISQKIENVGVQDLVFYCVCTPAFNQTAYHNEENETDKTIY